MLSVSDVKLYCFDSRPNIALQTAPLVAHKIVAILKAVFQLTLVPVYTAARLNADRWAATINARAIRQSYHRTTTIVRYTMLHTGELTRPYRVAHCLVCQRNHSMKRKHFLVLRSSIEV